MNYSPDLWVRQIALHFLCSYLDNLDNFFYNFLRTSSEIMWITFLFVGEEEGHWGPSNL